MSPCPKGIRGRELAGVEYKARAELAVVEHLVAERQRLAVAAIRISPARHISRRSWARGRPNR